MCIKLLQSSKKIISWDWIITFPSKNYKCAHCDTQTFAEVRMWHRREQTKLYTFIQLLCLNCVTRKHYLCLLGKSFVSRALQNSEQKCHSALKKIFPDEKIVHGWAENQHCADLLCLHHQNRRQKRPNLLDSTLMMAAAQSSEYKHPPDYRRHELERQQKESLPPSRGGGGNLKFYMKYEVMRQNIIMWIHQLPFPTRLLSLLRFPVSIRFTYTYTACTLPPRPIAFRALYESPLSYEDSRIDPFSSAP